MKKSNKIIRNVITVLAVIVISLIAFVGVYVEVNGVYQNLIPSFNYGMEIEGTRELRYLLNTTSEEKEVYVDENGNIMGVVPTTEEEQVDDGISLDTTVENKEENAEKEDTNTTGYKTEKRVVFVNPEVKTLEDFDNTKRVIQERLSDDKKLEYNIRLDTLSNNELIIEVANDEDQVSFVRSMIENVGKFEIIDEETGVVLMNNTHLKGASASAGYAHDEEGHQLESSQVYLTLNLTKEGREKLKDISNNYKVSYDEAGNDTSKIISVQIDGITVLQTAFSEEYNSDILQFPMGNATTDVEDLQKIYEDVTTFAKVVNSGKLPLVYELSSDNYIQSQITNDVVTICMIVFAALVVLISIVFVVKFKLNGLLGAILNVGYIALLVLVSRYADIVITLNSSLAFVAGTVLNTVFIYMFLNQIKNNVTAKEAFTETFKKVYLAMVPICIIAIIFTCLGNVIVGSIGTVLFWGILIQMLYGFAVIRKSYMNK